MDEYTTASASGDVMTSKSEEVDSVDGEELVELEVLLVCAVGVEDSGE